MEIRSLQNSAAPFLSVLQIIVFVSLILYVGKTLFIPLGFAFLISFLLFPLCSWTEKKGLPRVPAIILPVFFLFIIFTAAGYFLFVQIAELSYEWYGIKARVTEAIENVSVLLAQHLGLSADSQIEILQNLTNNAGNEILSWLGSTVSSFTEGFVWVK